MDHQNYFNFNANQLNTYFSIFITLLTTIIGAIGYGFDSEKYVMALLLSLVLSLTAFCFYHMFRRNRIMVKWAESHMDMEDESEFSRQQKLLGEYRFSLRQIHTLIYVVAFFSGLISAIVSLVLIF